MELKKGTRVKTGAFFGSEHFGTIVRLLPNDTALVSWDDGDESEIKTKFLTIVNENPESGEPEEELGEDAEEESDEDSDDSDDARDS